jgi:hypothetical protein
VKARIEIRHDGSGALRSVLEQRRRWSDMSDADDGPDLDYVARVDFSDGIPTRYSDSDRYDSTEAEFHPDGSLAASQSLYDPGSRSITCRSDGWETSHDHCDDDASCLHLHSSYTVGADCRPTSSHTTLASICSTNEIGEHRSYTAAWTWSGTGGAVMLQASDDGGGWQQTFSVVVTAGETEREFTADGNLSRVHIDEDGDGAADVTHTYRYEGIGACREGENPQLLERIPDQAGWLVPHRCRFSPVTDAILTAYDEGARLCGL